MFKAILICKNKLSRISPRLFGQVLLVSMLTSFSSPGWAAKDPSDPSQVIDAFRLDVPTPGLNAATGISIPSINSNVVGGPMIIGSDPQSQPIQNQTLQRQRDIPSQEYPRSATKDEQHEFQEFIRISSGKSLPIFGHQLFAGSPSTFAPVENIPVTPDYVIGPGDEIHVRAWGQIDINFKSAVDRNGSIYLPKVGEIQLAGIKYQDLNNYLKTAIGRVFKNFELTTSMGQLRSVQIFVVGHAKRPGSYTVSSLSSLVTAVFASGGPSIKGSMRSIQLKRGGKTVGELDVYDLLLKGDKSSDVKLLPGDTIYIPPVGPLAAITGSVNTEAVYELKNRSSLNDLLAWSGGLSSLAKGQKVTVERIVNRRTRVVDEFSLDKTGLSRLLQDGDLIRVHQLSPRFENSVTLRGNVAEAMRFPWRDGLRITDIIPNPEALVTASYWKTRNATVGQNSIDEKKLKNDIHRANADINWDYAVIERLNPQTLSTTLIPFNLWKAITQGDPSNNLLLQAGDIVTVFSKDDMQVPVEKRTKYIRLEGEVAVPGVYQIEPGETLPKLLVRIGGLTPNAYLYGANFTRESTRIQQQQKLTEMINRLERDMERDASNRARAALSPEDTAAIKAELESRRAIIDKMRNLKPSGRIVLELPEEAGSVNAIPPITLEDEDRLVIPARPSFVSVFGAVYNEAAFIFKNDKSVDDYLSQAGGPTRDADTDSIYVLRADGSVLSKRQAGLFGLFSSKRIMPGDAVIVPEQFSKTSWTKELKDWTQILYQFGLGAAAIQTLK